MSIYAKLLTVQKKINGLAEDSQTNQYRYVSGSKVLKQIKPLMNEVGLLLKQEILSIDNTRQDYNTRNGAKSEIMSKVMMRFTWIDVETGEKDENLFGANGQNDWEKGLGSALTYAERYFLLKYFHIATDCDDIDNEGRKSTPPVPNQKTPSAQKEPVQRKDPAPPARILTPEQDKLLNDLIILFELKKEGLEKKDAEGIQRRIDNRMVEKFQGTIDYLMTK
jgi:hypothetical protein